MRRLLTAGSEDSRSHGPSASGLFVAPCRARTMTSGCRATAASRLKRGYGAGSSAVTERPPAVWMMSRERRYWKLLFPALFVLGLFYVAILAPVVHTSREMRWSPYDTQADRIVRTYLERPDEDYDLEEQTNALLSRQFDPTPVITHRFPLEAADDAIRAIKAGEAGKVIFEIAG